MWGEGELRQESSDAMGEPTLIASPKAPVPRDPLRWLLVISVVVLIGLAAATASLSGFGWSQLRRIDQSRLEGTAVLRLAEGLFDDVRRAIGLYHWLRSELERRSGSPQAALAARRLAVESFSARPRQPNVFQVKYREARKLEKAGNFIAAEQAYRELLAQMPAGGGGLTEAFVLTDLGRLLLNSGRYGEGASILERSVVAWRATDLEFMAYLSSLQLEVVYSTLLGESAVLQTTRPLHQGGSGAGATEVRRQLDRAPWLVFGYLSQMAAEVTGLQGQIGFAPLLRELEVRHGPAQPFSSSVGSRTTACSVPPQYQSSQGSEFSWSRMRFVDLLHFGRPFLSATFYIKQGRWKEALALLDQLLAKDGFATLPLVRGCVQMLAGLSLWHTEDYEGAIERLRESVACLEMNASQLGSPELWRSHQNSFPSVVYPILLEMLVLRGHAEAALVDSERARSRALLVGVGTGSSVASTAGTRALEAEVTRLRAEILLREREVT